MAKSASILYSRDHGYICLVGRPDHGTAWMPDHIQSRAKQDYTQLEKALKKMTSAQLVSYLEQEHRTAMRGRKSDLVLTAMNKLSEVKK